MIILIPVSLTAQCKAHRYSCHADVDRMPLVSSAIIQVAQDIDEPWPVEVIAHDGTAHNISMLPGDMVLYESHSVLHGRPFPLKGRHYVSHTTRSICRGE